VHEEDVVGASVGTDVGSDHDQGGAEEVRRDGDAVGIGTSERLAVLGGSVSGRADSRGIAHRSSPVRQRSQLRRP
jgi:hypothetical protein